MKHFLFGAILSVTAVTSGWSTIGTYTNKANTTTVPLTPIDATNFWNRNIFSFATPTLYDFSNVQNYTNENVMANSGSGFRLDTTPTSGPRRMARSFYNKALAGNPSTNASVHANYQLLISATNIVNRGLLSAGSFGLVKLDGDNLDLSRGAFQMGTFTDRGSLFPEAVFDDYWGFGSNTFAPDFLVVEEYPATPSHNYIQFFPQFDFAPYTPTAGALFLLDLDGTSLNMKQRISEAGTNRSVQLVFVRNPNSNIVTQIKFGPNPTQNPPPAAQQVPIIEWAVPGTNAFGQVFTNTLYLQDEFAVRTNQTLVTNFPFASQPPQSVPIQPASFQPANYLVTRTAPPGFDFADEGEPFVEPDPSLWTTNNNPERIDALYSAYGFRAATTTTDPSQMDEFAITNVRVGPGRIELNASGKLDLNLARIDGLNYLSLNSTNHFAGASNATVMATYVDANLGSTNGNLDTTGLLRNTLPRLNGTVQCYSAKWRNLVFYENGNTNSCDFHILVVDSDLQETTAPQLFNLSLRSTNAVVDDTFTVIDKLSLNVANLTIRSNGVIQVYNADVAWSDSAPDIKTFTNHGTMDFTRSVNEMTFVSQAPGGGTVPYAEFVNFGQILNIGTYVSASNILNGGIINSAFGPMVLDAASDLTLLELGALQAPNADLNLSCHNLNVTNHLFTIGRALNLSVTNSLNAGTNDWLVYDGFNLLTKPATGDLLETTITDSGFAYAEVMHAWAGEDRGSSSAGFTDNAALGRLNLDGGIDTIFTFSGTGPADNAMYLDVLVLQNSATNIVDGTLTAVNVNPGMKLYFSEAFIDDGFGVLTDVTALLTNTASGVVQVSYTGPLSLSKPATILNPALRVTVEQVPQAKSLVSWDTVPGGTNYLYCTGHPYSESWQLVTNFVSGPAGGVVTVADPGLTSSRFYKVRVDVPGQ